MANTIATHHYRQVYRLAKLDALLRKALVAEAVFMVDRSGLKTIESPYGSQPTSTVQTLKGTYSIDTWTSTEDQLSVDEEIVTANHVHDYNETLTNWNTFVSRVDELNNSFKTAVDKFALNDVLDQANGSYSTPAGGFTTAANFNVILSNLLSKVAGYQGNQENTFLVVENTDLPGIIQAMGAQGFTMADTALRNGLIDSYMGVDIYVVRSGVFSDESTSSASGGNTWTNAGHRLFGVKKVATYAAPQGMKMEEKFVTGKTGKEVVVYGYIGVKAWVSKYDLLIDITIV